MPPFEDFKPYFVTGLSLGGVYAMSGVAIVVLYRATGVLNLAFGAIGAMGALISWTIINYSSVPDWLAYLICIAFGGVVTLVYGLIFGPPLARRDPLVKAVGTLGLALILLGIMENQWPPKSRSMLLPTSNWHYQIGIVQITWTQIIGFGFGILVTILVGAFLRFTRLGSAMRALADDREITATLGVPVRRVESVAWFGSGLIAGAAGLLLSNLVSLDAVTLSIPLVISVLAAALIGRLSSLVVTLVAGLVVGLASALLVPILTWPDATYSLSVFHDATPFALAILALLWVARRRVVSIGRSGGR